MSMKKVIRCANKKNHNKEGNILCIIGKTGIYVQCRDLNCKRRTFIELSLPYLNPDYTKAGITQKEMPKGYHFDLEKAVTIVEE